MAIALATVEVMSSLRSDVLRMYKSILRLSRTWESKNVNNTQSERMYIEKEAKRLFRENRNLTADTDVKKKLNEAYSRVEIARHYGIAYPRPVYYGTGSYTKQNKRNIQKK
ncbi:LYR motif-containing protein 1 [Halotydeus destructor]|nr:LYR motif-containing protein 1 [Halotydeus destructor]